MQVKVHKAILSEPIPYEELKMGEFAVIEGISGYKGHVVHRIYNTNVPFEQEKEILIASVNHGGNTWAFNIDIAEGVKSFKVRRILPGSKIVIVP